MRKLIVAIVVGMFFLSIFGQYSVAADQIQLPREETLYVGGGLWSQPNNFNPTVSWAAVTGTIGLIYETLFTYDPLKDQLEPWLAESGEWISDNTYRVVLKEGLTWQDGKPLTAEDVKFTFDYAKEHQGLSYSPIWGWLKEVKVVDDRTVEFVFSEPHYEEWKYWLYSIAIIPEHIWKDIKEPQSFANTENPVGSGMYKLYRTDQMRFILVRNDNWWGIKYYGKPAPKYIVYVIVYSNNLALSMLVKGDLDWSNFFIPGVPDVKSKYGIVTWFDKEPYHLPINTAFLFLNNQKVFFKAHRGEGRPELAFDTSIPLDEGLNTVVVFARENDDLISRRTLSIYRRPAAIARGGGESRDTAAEHTAPVPAP